MSCQINIYGAIADLESVKKCLYLDGFSNRSTSLSSKSSREKRLSTEDDVWGWSVDDGEKPVSHTNWLDECGVSLSSTGELMALTHRQNLVILTSKWDSNEESTIKTKYHMIWNGDPCQEHNESITCVCVLPLAAPQKQKSSHSAPDWTCIALGFSSGALRFYTEKGDLLLSEVLDEGPVASIKCQTVTSTRHTGQPELTEELHVSYNLVICSVYGFVLSNTLRACRNQLARVQANCSDGIVAPPLSLHKWSLPDQESVADCAVGLPQCPSAFTHLQIASVCGGFNTWYRPSPPQSSLVVAVGNKPFVGFHYIVEGSNAPVLTDVVKAVGTKLKSALNQAVPSWFLGGRKPLPVQEKEKVVIEPAEPMACRFGLCDLWRRGCFVTMSPLRNLCVVSDTLGRVMLIDNSSGIALRMWKGYREAQCGWLTAEEELNSGQGRGRRRQALFLVIYSPKKGIVEVWAMQQGPRVATFSTSKSGRLIFLNHGLLGISSLGNKNPNRSSAPCIFIDEFGVMSEIIVPFHCALSDKNSKRARDVHLLRKMKQLLKGGGGGGEDEAVGIGELCRDLQTHAIRGQVLDLLCGTKAINANTLLEVVEGFLHTLQSEEEDTIDADKRSLRQRCLKLQKLLIFFLFCTGLHQNPPDYDTVISSDCNEDLENLSEFLRLSKESTTKLLQSPGNDDKKVRVKFHSKVEGLAGYIAGFRMDSISDDVIYLAEPSTNQNILHIGEIVCGGTGTAISEWRGAAADSGIDSLALLRLSITSWLNHRTWPSVADTHAFGQLVSAVCNIAGERVQESEWWDEARNILKESTQPQLAVIAAVVCKAVAVTFEESAVMTASAGTDDSETKTSDWEKVTQESCSWSLLISQLEDIALVSTALKQKQQSSNSPKLFCLPYDPPEMSLQNICSKGRGYISEVVARWVASHGLDLALLSEGEGEEEGSRETSTSPDTSHSGSLGVVEGKVVAADCGEEARPVTKGQAHMLQTLITLRSQFPYSLAGSVLLANVTWEYTLAWSRQPDCLNILQSALHCLLKIPSAHAKQGVCTLMWSMHLKSRFESVLRLINKIGKVPKERLCRQDIGLSEIQVADFFDFLSTFFDIFLECRAASEQRPKEEVRHEELWESVSVSPVPPLHQLVLSQPPAHYDTLLLLSQCARAMCLLATFNLRTPRPLSGLFDTIGQSALFADLHAPIPLPSHAVDPALTETRTHFLLRAVTAAMANIICHQQEYNMTGALEWMKQCLLLAADWCISADPLRRQQCYQLYLLGYDRLAEEVIPSVNDTSALGSQLLLLAGQRLRLSMAQSKAQLREQLTHMSPALFAWLSGLKEMDVKDTSLADTLELVVVASSLQEPESEGKRIASMLVDALAPIVNKEKGQSSDR